MSIKVSYKLFATYVTRRTSRTGRFSHKICDCRRLRNLSHSAMHSVANSKASIGGLLFRSTSHSNRIDPSPQPEKFALVPIMAAAMLALSLYRDIKIPSATIDHKLSPPIARHKSNIENIDGPNLGWGV